MLLTCVSLAGILLGQQTPPSLSSDPRFAQHVSLTIKNERVKDALNEISKQASVPVGASGSVADYKITIFVKDEPVGLVLDKIASVLDMVWDPSGGYEYLAVAPAEKQKLRDYLDKEDKVFRADATRTIGRLENAASGSYDDFVQAMSSGPQDGPPAQRSHPMLPYSPIGATEQSYAAGKMFRDWSASDWDAFWNGEVGVTGAARNPQGGGAADNTNNGNNGRLGRRRGGGAGGGQAILVKYNAFSDHTLELVTAPTTLNGHPFQLPEFEKPEDTLATTPFGQEVTAWPNLDASSTIDALNQDLGPAGAEPTDAAGGHNFVNPPPTRRFRPRSMAVELMSDQLERLFNRSGLPIVATGFRIAEPVAGVGPAIKTPLDWLKSCRDVDSAFIRVEDGVVMVRHGGFWRLQQSEIPDVAIRPLAAKGDKVNLNDYVSFIGQLTPAQAESLRAENAPILGFDYRKIVKAIPALKFLAALGQIPAPDKPISFERLDSQSQELFLNAMYDGLFMGANWSGSGPGGAPATYGFVISEANVSEEQGVTTGVSMLFGSSKQNGIVYQAPVPIP